MSRHAGWGFVVMCLLLAAGGEAWANRGQHSDPAVTYAVPVAGSPAVGNRDALVTVVMGFEFAEPYSFRSKAMLEGLLRQYKGDVRVVYKHFVVHPNHATIPARAACAAHRQRRFAAMYDLIWRKAFRSRKFGRNDMLGLAQSLGLNMRRFTADLDGRCAAVVRNDRATMARFGQRGTPTFFVNGRIIVGFRPQLLRQRIDEERDRARKRIARGAARRGNYYRRFVLKRGLRRVKWVARGSGPGPRGTTAWLDPSAVYSVSVAGAPSVGNPRARVTMVKGYEYACLFCERSRATTRKLLAHYKGQLRVVYKHFVVHPTRATLPAQAVCAAHRQGRFKAMDELLWRKAYKVRDFSRANLLRLARNLGLNLGRFTRDMDGPCKTVVARDLAELKRVGQRGAPTFYINGRVLSGARPFAAFKRVIDEELRRANRRIARGGATAATYYRKYVVRGGLKAATRVSRKRLSECRRAGSGLYTGLLEEARQSARGGKRGEYAFVMKRRNTIRDLGISSCIKRRWSSSAAGCFAQRGQPLRRCLAKLPRADRRVLRRALKQLYRQRRR